MKGREERRGDGKVNNERRERERGGNGRKDVDIQDSSERKTSDYLRLYIGKDGEREAMRKNDK